MVSSKSRRSILRAHRSHARIHIAFVLGVVLIGFLAGEEHPSQGRSDTSVAFQTAIDRLEDGRDTPQVGALFLEALSVAPTVADVEDLVAAYFNDITYSRQRSLAAQRVGTIYELSHRYELARRYYQESMRIAPGDDRSALAFARVSIEIGNLTEGLITLNKVVQTPGNRDYQREAAVLRARIYALTGETERAVQHARALAGLDRPVDEQQRKVIDEGAFNLLLDIAQRTDNTGLRDEAFQRLQVLYPDSPTTLLYTEEDRQGVLALSSSVTAYPTPSRIISTANALSATPVTTVIPERQRPVQRDAENLSDQRESMTERVIGIQTGSFRDRENAEYMVKDIEAAGYDAVIRTVEISGNTFFRVLVDVSGSPQDVQEYVVRLKERGIEGFLVFDE